eukprot:345140-Chlamydomonas_euryale.AAC.7
MNWLRHVWIRLGVAFWVAVWQPLNMNWLPHMWIRLGVAFWVAFWQPLKHELAAARVDKVGSGLWGVRQPKT